MQIQEGILDACTKAAILIQYANDGFLVRKTLDTVREAEAYRIRNKYHIMFQMAAWGLLVVRFFNRGNWTFEQENWDKTSIFPNSGIPHLSIGVSTALSMILASILIYSIYLEFIFEKSRKRRRILYFFAAMMVLKIINVTVRAFVLLVGDGLSAAFALLPFEAVGILLVERCYTGKLDYLSRTIPPFIALMCLFGLFLCWFTMLGLILFPNTSEEHTDYFKNFGGGLWNMLMVLNGSNWPSPMIPAYVQNRAYSIFFIAYLIVGNWGLINLFTGLVYALFKSEQLISSEKLDRSREFNVGKAFALLSGGKNYVTVSQVDAMLKALFFYSPLFIVDTITQEDRYQAIRLLFEEDMSFISGKETGGHSVHDINRLIRPKFPRMESGYGFESEDLSHICRPDARISDTQFENVWMVCSASIMEIILRERRERTKNEMRAKYAENAIIVVQKSGNDSFVRKLSGDFKSTTSNQLSAALVTPDTKNHHLDSDDNKMETPSTVYEGLSLQVYVWYLRFLLFCMRTLDNVFFDMIMDTCIFVVGVLFLVDATPLVAKLIIAFVVFELVFKLWLKGVYRCSMSYRTRYDGFVALGLVAIYSYRAVTHMPYDQVHESDGLVVSLEQLILILRLLMYPRNAVQMSNRLKTEKKLYREGVTYLFSSATDFVFLCYIFVFAAMVFAVAGEQFYGGLIRKEGGNYAKLLQSDYGESGYWPLNFNDIPSGLATMFTLLHVNNMHVTASGFQAVSASGSRTFFLAWYAIGVVLLLNILTALFLNEFIAYLRKRKNLEHKKEKLRRQEEERNNAGNAVSIVNPINSNIDSATGGDIRMSKLSSTSDVASVSTASVDEDTVHREDVVGFRETVFGDNQLRNTLNKWVIRNTNTLFNNHLKTQDLKGSMHYDRYADNQYGVSGVRPTVSNLFGMITPHETHARAQAPIRKKLLSAQFTEEDMNNIETANHILNHHPEVHLDGRGSSFDTRSEHADDSSARAEVDGVNSDMANQTDVAKHLNFSEEKMSPDAENDSDGNIKEPLDDTRFSREERKKSKFLEGDTSDLNFFVNNRDSSIFDWMTGSIKIESHSYQAAAIMVQFAREGTIRDPLTTARAADAFRLHNRLRLLFNYTAWALLIIRIFERPLWTYHKYDWNNMTLYPRSGLPFMSPGLVVGLMIPLLCIILFGLGLEMLCKDNMQWSNYKAYSVVMIARIVLIVVSLIELAALIGILSTHGLQHAQLEQTSYLNFLLVFWFDRDSKKMLHLIIRMIPRFMALLTAFAVIILMFGWIGVIVFKIDQDVNDDGANYQYFGTYPNSVWSVFVAITSSSYPNQMMPGYTEVRLSILYYMTYIVIGAYIMVNVILVVILISFQRGVQAMNDVEQAGRIVNLLRAFDMLDAQARGFVTTQQVNALLVELNNNYSAFSSSGMMNSADKREIMVATLDLEGDGVITPDEFVHLLDITRLVVGSSDVRNTRKYHILSSWFPFVFKTPQFMRFINFASSNHFDPLCDVVISAFLIAIFVCIVQNPNETVDGSHGDAVAILLVVATALMIIEMTVKIFVMGWAKYSYSYRNMSNGGIAVLFVALIMINKIATEFSNHNKLGNIAIKIFATIRVLFLPRNLEYLFPSIPFSQLAHVIGSILSRLRSLSITFFIFTYGYACLGVNIFGGKICTEQTASSGNNDSKYCVTYDDVSATDYGLNNFYTLNFNDITSGVVTLISCLHVSDFDVIADGFVGATNEYAKIYFAFWYCFGVLLILSIVKSFFLTGFLESFAKVEREEERRRTRTSSRSTVDTDGGEGIGVLSKANNSIKAVMSNFATLLGALSYNIVFDVIILNNYGELDASQTIQGRASYASGSSAGSKSSLARDGGKSVIVVENEDYLITSKTYAISTSKFVDMNQEERKRVHNRLLELQTKSTTMIKENNVDAEFERTSLYYNR